MPEENMRITASRLRTFSLVVVVIYASWTIYNVSRINRTKLAYECHKCEKTVFYGVRDLSESVASTAKPSVVDMVNGYHPYVDFKLVYPSIVPVREMQECFMVVVVNSAARGLKHSQRRETIRNTWASHTTCEQSKNKRRAKLKWCLIFMLGKTEDEDDNERNIEEARKFDDMIIGDIQDTYINNIIKIYMAQLWISTLHNVKYILKTDDDVYVRIPSVLQHLADKGFPSRYNGGAKYGLTYVDRTIGGRWALSRKYFSEKGFPSFNPGAYFVLSADLLRPLLHYTNIRKPFHTDDAYIGVAMRDMNVPVRKIEGFNVMLKGIGPTIKARSDCETLERIAVGHNLTPDLMIYLHNRLENLCLANITLDMCKKNVLPTPAKNLGPN